MELFLLANLNRKRNRFMNLFFWLINIAMQKEMINFNTISDI
ncbi:hypothetical protein AC229_1644 [Oenococcus oeni]|nr:hypothetical protein AC229_1644 [Oenococcus oeni]